MKQLIINGPNINFLGIREKNIYGNQDYNFLLELISISDINTREEFRKISVTADACNMQIKGEGLEGYLHAMEEISKLINAAN